MSDEKKIDEPTGMDTTGHSWDGIEELNTPLPRWWLWTFYATIIWGVGYTIAYPAWPMISQATSGVLGYSTRAEVAAEIAEVDAANATINEKLATVELASITGDQELLTYATNAGASVFRSWCSQCHGSGAAGVQASGYPNLLDDDWLWGGTIEDIHTTISVGIRQETDEDWVRQSEMPAFGRDGLLEEEEIFSVVNYVMSFSGEPNDAALVSAGEEVYLDNCAACHMDDGSGDVFQGAPNLADAIWLYGGDYETIYESVYNSRYGKMPRMGGAQLTEAEIRAVATYVHGLGGGE